MKIVVFSIVMLVLQGVTTCDCFFGVKKSLKDGGNFEYIEMSLKKRK